MNNNTSSSNKNHLSIVESPRRRTKSFTSILGLKNTFSLKDHALESRKSSLGSPKSFNNLRRGSKSQDRSSGSGRSGGSGIDSTGGIGKFFKFLELSSNFIIPFFYEGGIKDLANDLYNRRCT